MTPVVGPGKGRLAVITLAAGLGVACCGLLSALSVEARAQTVQAGSEGGSLSGGIPPAHRATRPQVRPTTHHEQRSVRTAGRPDDGLARFDGTWSVSSGGGCPAAGNGEVRIAHGHVLAANGSGRVGPDGAVDTVTTVAGMTVVGQGRIVGNAASGSYRQSDGCTGPWSAVRL